MGRKSASVSRISFTDRELDVMCVLWREGPSSVREVRAALEIRLAYTTVLTTLRVLEGKGRVTHVKEGRSHRYRPLITREAATRSAVESLICRYFDGSTDRLRHYVTQHISAAG